jgi:hypothetical protein
MKKQIRIVKKGEDNGNLQYWLSLSKVQRLEQLEDIREEVNQRLYETQQGFQRVYRIVKRA